MPNITGQWYITQDYGPETSMKIDADGNVITTQSQGKWIQNNDTLTITWANNTIDTLYIQNQNTALTGRRNTGEILRGTR